MKRAQKAAMTLPLGVLCSDYDNKAGVYLGAVNPDLWKLFEEFAGFMRKDAYGELAKRIRERWIEASDGGIPYFLTSSGSGGVQLASNLRNTECLLSRMDTLRAKNGR